MTEAHERNQAGQCSLSCAAASIHVRTAGARSARVRHGCLLLLCRHTPNPGCVAVLDRGAGTDANVSIEMFGTTGAVGQTRLESHGNNFERGQVDTFVVKGTDIGDVTRIIICHDNSGVGSAWHCQQVDVFNPATQKTYFFACNAWLEKSKEEGMAGCRKELTAGTQGAGGAQQCGYKVEVKTGDVRGAGTGANVQICVYGASGDTGLQSLDNSRNNFERNQLDTFFFKAPDIGAINSCRVVFDGSGLGAEWFLDYITVTNATTGLAAKFVYNGWLDAKTGWTQLLTAEGQAKDTSQLVDYQVTVITSDVRGAGTDGEVYLSLKGDKGAMGETRLENSRSNFSRNAVDVFQVAGTDIGRVQEAQVRLIEKGLGAAWHLAEIEVLNKKTGAKARFVYKDWLEKSAAHPDASVTLFEASTDAAKANKQTCEWRVVTQTGNMFGAGTDAPVWIQVTGPAGMLGGAEIYLDNSKNNLERGKTDTFLLSFPVDKDCGVPINKLVVERGRSCGLGSDWFLDLIEVTDVSRGHTYKWSCGQWLSDRDGLRKEWAMDKAAQGVQQPLTLVEAPGGAEPAAGQVSVAGGMYRLQFTTSDKLGAGTDATVRLELTDTQGHTWQPHFPQDKSMFERGTNNEFLVSSLAPLGELAAARVWLEHSGLGDAWHLASLHVTHLPSQRQWQFALNDWLPKQGATLMAQVVNDVPLQPPAELPDTRAASDQAAGAAPAPVPRPPTQYELVVTTGNKYGAGTDATITCVLAGTAGQASHTFDQAKSLFERGSVDRFSVRLPDCGDLTTLKLWHDGSGFGADWYVERVSVEALAYGCKYEATFSAWLKGGEDKGVARPLSLVSGAPPSATPAGAQLQAQLAAQGALQAQQAAAAGAAAAAAAGGARPRLQPGDPGVHPQVVDPQQFQKLAGMQEGDVKRRLSRDITRSKEPACEWQRYTMPYPQDPRYVVTYYHNSLTGASSYEKPPELATWEQQHSTYLTSVLQ